MQKRLCTSSFFLNPKSFSVEKNRMGYTLRSDDYMTFEAWKRNLQLRSHRGGGFVFLEVAPIGIRGYQRRSRNIHGHPWEKNAPRCPWMNEVEANKLALNVLRTSLHFCEIPKLVDYRGTIEDQGSVGGASCEPPPQMHKVLRLCIQNDSKKL